MYQKTAERRMAEVKISLMRCEVELMRERIESMNRRVRRLGATGVKRESVVDMPTVFKYGLTGLGNLHVHQGK